jgi:peptidoglycan/xylan/chitin deacetylase (PgdA/CDA1 family)
MWKDGCRCAVGFSFDFDAESLWMGIYKHDYPVVLARGEYGARAGLPRILNILARHEVEATFFVPGFTAEKHPESVRRIHEAGHELAHHGHFHENPGKLTLAEEEEVLDKGIARLRDITGYAPRGYRLPSGVHSPHTLNLLLERGFRYESSMVADDLPYLLQVGEGGRPLLEIPFSWELDDAPHFMFSHKPYRTGMSSPSKVYEIWAAEFEVCYQEGGYYGLTCHPQVIGRRHRAQMLEKLIAYIKSFPDVWIARHIDIAEHLLESGSWGRA